ncbi:YeeE/YedE family protein [Limnohabitans sp. Rim8]|uniref:YeeE/YedE family protein n=1 Tax=Limnohabitans sp. Rim8 TaxID=1100718 RepID=UPI00262F9B23|nr:YeeE/YedE family protein [Limnohabitans sp. Rim8]
MHSISVADLHNLTVQIWIIGFVLSLAVGVLIHRGHFCTMGAISDWVVMQDATRLRQWALALAVAMMGFGTMALLGWIDPANTIYAAKHLSWLSGLFGGALFGVGMVLASGCSSKTLVRLGAGNLKSLVVLLAMAVAALATMKGLTAVWRVNFIDPIGVHLSHGPFMGQWLSAMTGLSLSNAWGLSAGLVALILLVWVTKGRGFNTLFNWVTGAGLGLLVVAFWWLSGIFGFVPEHPETLEPFFLTTHSGRMEALSFTAPVGYWLDALLYYSDGSKRLTLGMVTVLGVLSGACISSILQGSFRWESFTQRSDLLRHLVGGSLMGAGGVLAMGCTFGQGLTGLSTLSLGSAVSVTGIFVGAYTALQWQMRKSQ